MDNFNTLLLLEFLSLRRRQFDTHQQILRNEETCIERSYNLLFSHFRGLNRLSNTQTTNTTKASNIKLIPCINPSFKRFKYLYDWDTTLCCFSIILGSAGRFCNGWNPSSWLAEPVVRAALFPIYPFPLILVANLIRLSE